ncbi:holocytochrome c synthase [Podochytrium sp. JEL0797]|nr:holocytochrome c synthase [Podochytrium sp. JEL0797]
MSSNSKDGCPVDHTAFAKAASGCPVPHNDGTPNPHGLNPLNNIPLGINDRMADGQTVPLSLDREVSTIPRSDTKSNWDYPSPQAFYNALKRKGWETHEEDVPTMVAIHNFLNEACWEEIQKWEEKYHCDCKDLKLTRFQGRPQELSPKARWNMLVNGAEKPFDRHDWTVNRCGKDVRYVIDYYSGHDEPDNPAFNCDVRPALDSPGAIFDRAKEFAGNTWTKWFGN